MASRSYPLCRGTLSHRLSLKLRQKCAREQTRRALSRTLCKETENSPQAAQSSCCPATTVGRESPGLKLASSSPPRQFHHSLWQRGPCGEVTTEARLSQDNKGLGKGSTEQSPALPSWSAPSWKLEKHIKSRSICMYGTQPLLCFCSSSMSVPIRYTLS